MPRNETRNEKRRAGHHGLIGTRTVRSVAGATLIAGLGVPFTSALASNATYQTFLTSTCATATGALITRCAEGSGTANVSGDSESSLNPSQPLSSQASSLAQARDKSLEASEKMDDLRSNKDGATNIGTFSFLANGRRSIFDRTRETTDAERGISGDSTAFEIGMDYRTTTRTVFGGFIDYQKTSSTFDADVAVGTPFTPQTNAGSIDSNMSGVTFFLSHNFNDRAYVEGSLGYRFGDYEFSRNAVFQESTRTQAQRDVLAVGNTDGTQLMASVGFGFEINKNALTLSPRFRTTYTRSKLDDYTEADKNNNGLEMNVSIDDSQSLTTNLGLGLSVAISTPAAVLVPQFRVEWAHEFKDDPQEVTTSFVLDTDNTEYKLTGDKPDRDYYNIGISFVGVFAQGWMAFFDYERVAGYKDLDRKQFTLGARLEF